MKNQLYEIFLSERGVDKNLLAYTCGHCSNVIVLRPERERERETCYQCGRWICEKSSICLTHCTPIHEMAKDHFEGVGERGKFIPAIMAGITSVEEALSKSLIIP